MIAVMEAIFENGAFRPIDSADTGIVEGQHVRLVVESQPGEAILKLAAKVYEGLAPDEIDDIERIALDRSRFFSEREP